MTPSPPNFAVPNFVFPNFIPGRYRIPPDFKLWPDVFLPGQAEALQAGTLPVTPPIPPTVVSTELITAVHENTVTTALNDLWINEQWIAANMLIDPTTTKGDLLVRGASLSRFPVGANGYALLADNAQALGVKWGPVDANAIGAVPTTRRVIAGVGMSGGGALSADVTLTANVTSVFGRVGTVTLNATDVSSVGGVLNTRRVIAGAGLGGGGDLSADRTFTVVDDTTNQRVKVLYSGALTGTRPAVNLIPGSNITLAVADDAVNNRVNVTINAAGGSGGVSFSVNGAKIGTRYGLNLIAGTGITLTGVDNAGLGQVNVTIASGGGMTDPTTTFGDLIVRGSTAVARLGMGNPGQVLTVDINTGVQWRNPPSGSLPPGDMTGDVLYWNGIGAQWQVMAVGNDDEVLSADSSSSTGLRWQVPDVPQAPSFYVNGALVYQAFKVNFIAGTNVTISGAVNAGQGRADITINSTGGSQSPWTSNINAAGFALNGVGKIAIGQPSATHPLQILATATTATLANTTVFIARSAAGSFAGIGISGVLAVNPCIYAVLNTDDLAFGFDSAGTMVERMRITAAGYVGIGATSPQARLSLGSTGGVKQLWYDGSNSQYNSGVGLNLAPGQGLDVFMGFGTGTDTSFRICRPNAAAWPFASYTALVTVLETGNVGIGTTNPGSRLAVAGLPSSAAGLTSGDLWYDPAAGNVLKIVP